MLWPWLGLLACSSREPAPGRPVTPQRPSAAYDALRRPELLVAALQLQPGQWVGEIGAGGGYLTGYLARGVGPTGRVVATDIDEAALAALRQRTQQLPQVEARKVTALQPGLEAGRYDLILLAQVDHLLTDRVAYLRALQAALAPHGRIVVVNGMAHQEPARAAILAAGYMLEEKDAQLPGQFLFLVRPR